MRTRTTTATAAALLLATLTACSDNGPTVTKAEAAAEPTLTSASPTPEAPQQTTFKFGETANVEDTKGISFATTAYSYTQPVKGPQPPTEDLGGDVWATIEVKVCNVKGETISVSQFPWSLAYADDTRIEVTGLNGGDLPKPEFAPMGDSKVRVGDCLRGKIPFAVPSDKRPERILYSPESLDDPLEWAVPAK
ncbi:DUF4352 domain-containing protein [Streptomyces sp. GMY02]|uniref:DUF4352 domain-containing protein n=1 Tax=Streptomyces sp. GMY02 TaxID=1333528 RepID=UPI001C2C0C2C|nr:DUF4352 domain-containing protein [Streptomyces sp. GMY02]QXE36964.1 DUF4352 domain-containing protein [Streptomyces sp. GMY02]